MKKLISIIVACTLLMSSLVFTSSAISYKKHQEALDTLDWVIRINGGIYPHLIDQILYRYYDYENSGLVYDVPRDEVEDFVASFATDAFMTATGAWDVIRSYFNYDDAKEIYHIPNSGTEYRPLSLPEWFYWGHTDVGDGFYDFAYRRRIVEFTDELTLDMALEIGFNDDWLVEWNGDLWDRWNGEFFRVVGYESQGFVIRMDLSGDTPILAGFYDFDGVPFEFDKDPVLLLGDVNGDGKRNSKDIATLLKYFAGVEVYVFDEACDYNNNGNINSKDVSAMLKAAANGEF